MVRATSTVESAVGGATVVEGVLVAVGVLAFVALVLLLLRTPPEEPPVPTDPHPDSDGGPAAPRRAAVVVNPTKFEAASTVRDRITEICTELGWAEPAWIETTAEDPGAGQARQALDDGAELVMACGGDGTVRSVAETMAGTDVPMGLLPAGTGNLLARNLDMRLDDMDDAVRTALTGRDRRIDVGRMVVDDLPEQVFLVMAGMGFDAQMMAGAPDDLKAKVGPAAYVVSGARHLNGRRIKLTLAVDDEPAVHRRSRMVVVGNCGKLLGGIVLMPDAEVDDGRLDVVSLAPKGVIGWAAVAGQLVTRQRKGHPVVERWTGQAITVSASEPTTSQLDGELIGDVTTLRMRVDPGALVVRVGSDA